MPFSVFIPCKYLSADFVISNAKFFHFSRKATLMSLVDRILIHENHAIEIVFKYRDEYQQTLEYVLGYADELDIAV